MVGKSIGRRFVDVAQKARGREAFRYEFEVIPYTAWELSDGQSPVLFAWERGSKVFVTDAVDVKPNKAVFWQQFLKQQATIYRGPSGFLPKEYVFKIQHMKAGGKADERKTIAKVTIDLAQFCTGQVEPQPVDKFLQLKPSGKLKVSIKATWLKDAKIEADAMTEMSGPSMFNDAHEEQEEDTEQDLSGFDHANGGEAAFDRRTGPGGDDDREERRRRRRERRRREREAAGSSEPIPEDEDPDDSASQQRKESTRKQREQQAGDAYSQPAAGTYTQANPDMEMGQRLYKKTWKDYLLCCCAPKPGMGPVYPQEDEELLSTKPLSNPKPEKKRSKPKSAGVVQ